MPDTPDATTDQAELFQTAGWAAIGAYRSTAGDHNTRLRAVIAGHLRALAESGLLTAPPPGVDVPSVDDDARWLATQSGHPRFTDGDGWRLLLTSEPDILMAYDAAVRRRPNQQTAAWGREATVRDRLLWRASHPDMLC